MAEEKKNIDINPKHKGWFTEKAKAHNMTNQEFAEYVLNHSSKFDLRTIREANFAKNSKKFEH